MSPGSKAEAPCAELKAEDRKALSAKSVAFLIPKPPCLIGREDVNICFGKHKNMFKKGLNFRSLLVSLQRVCTKTCIIAGHAM